jgi:hypothetical protein
MTGNLMWVVLTCDRGDWLLCPDRLLRGELRLDNGCSTTGCRSSLNFALISKYCLSNNSRSSEWSVSSCNSSSSCAVSYLLKIPVSSPNLTLISLTWGHLIQENSAFLSVRPWLQHVILWVADVCLRPWWILLCVIGEELNSWLKIWFSDRLYLGWRVDGDWNDATSSLETGLFRSVIEESDDVTASTTVASLC